MKTIAVKASAGMVGGYQRDGVFHFRGIPYAQAPLGELRFSPPQPLPPWEGLYDGTVPRPIPPQVPSNLDLPMGPVTREQSEDCLTLTVTTPRLDGSLPVAIWFHGGANVCGGGDLDWYDGSRLAVAGNMVVVNVNFRLGSLGFLVHPAVNEENLSILDQIVALQWVRENIRSFGGDPERVTVFGQSAGANAILHMVSLPQTEGLFHRMILESPSIGRANYTKVQAIEIAEKLLEYLGIDPALPDKIRPAILAKSTGELLAATDRCAEYFAGRYVGMIFKPVMDAWSTPDAAIAAAAKEAGRRRMPIIIGTTRDEMHAFGLERGEEAERRGREVQMQRYDRPAMEFASQAAEAGCPVWKYRFDWSASDSPYDACHCIELPFVFGRLEAWQNAPMLRGASHAEMERLRDTMQALWCRFIVSGDQDESAWPRFSRGKPQHKIFDNCENSVCEIRL